MSNLVRSMKTCQSVTQHQGLLSYNKGPRSQSEKKGSYPRDSQLHCHINQMKNSIATLISLLCNMIFYNNYFIIQFFQSVHLERCRSNNCAIVLGERSATPSLQYDTLRNPYPKLDTAASCSVNSQVFLSFKLNIIPITSAAVIKGYILDT